MLAESNETTRTENKLHQNYTFWCSSVRFGSVRIGSRTVSQNLKYRRARNAIETNEILRQQPSPGTNVYGILNIIQRI